MGIPAPEKARRAKRPIHPDARAGGGGPGYFRDANSVLNDDSYEGTVRHAKSPAGRLLIADAGSTLASGAWSTKKKKPPKTKPTSKVLATQGGPEVNLDVRVRVLPDRKNATGIPATSAKTTIQPSSGLRTIAPMQWRTSAAGKITAITKKLVVRGTYTIRTSYGKKAKPTDVSRYGRGTTPKDKSAGDVTLGFHEWCHQQEYLDYLDTHAFPKFTGKVGMSESDFSAAFDKFANEFQAFGDGILALGPGVDEVGYTKSRCEREGKC